MLLISVITEDVYKRQGLGSFQISTTSQTVRFDCYSMGPADMKRFSSILSKFGCPLYDPQQGVRFDKLCAFLVDEAGEYKTQVEQSFSRLLPRLELSMQAVTWDEYVQLSKTIKHIKYNAVIHRAKTMTKVTSFIPVSYTHLDVYKRQGQGHEYECVNCEICGSFFHPGSSFISDRFVRDLAKCSYYPRDDSH